MMTSGDFGFDSRALGPTPAKPASATVLDSSTLVGFAVVPSAGRLVAAHRPVTGEGGVEHALAARQFRQLPLEVLRANRG
jgi:hypothetical protein